MLFFINLGLLITNQLARLLEHEADTISLRVTIEGNCSRVCVCVCVCVGVCVCICVCACLLLFRHAPERMCACASIP